MIFKAKNDFIEYIDVLNMIFGHYSQQLNVIDKIIGAFSAGDGNFFTADPGGELEISEVLNGIWTISFRCGVFDPDGDTIDDSDGIIKMKGNQIIGFTYLGEV